MPYWSIYCVHCNGYIADALLECIPASQRAAAEYQFLFNCSPGAALACPYCNQLIGFNDVGEPHIPKSGWPVFRYGQIELEIKKQSDGESATTSFTDWALKHRFVQPGTQGPFSDYTYAEQAPPNELVP